MTRIGLISDTHGFLDEKVFDHFRESDEVWHAGDFGSMEIAEKLKGVRSDAEGSKRSGSDRDGRTLRGVYGNIDGQEIRSIFPEQLVFECEQVKVMMRHIGGYPPKYNMETKKQLALHKPKLFISGHSHILKVIFDPVIDCLHLNPGAAGKQGWQKMRTIIRFAIDGPDIKNCEVIELGPK
jgi:predicted phosphodiesterase